jgi:hypothetical protein
MRDSIIMSDSVICGVNHVGMFCSINQAQLYETLSAQICADSCQILYVETLVELM